MAKGRLWGARSGSGQGGGERKDHGQGIEARPCDLGDVNNTARLSKKPWVRASSRRRKCGPSSSVTSATATRMRRRRYTDNLAQKWFDFAC